MLSFRKTPVAIKFFDKGYEGEKPDFPSKNFCITVPKIIVGEPFCAVFHKNSSSDKVFWQRV